MTLNMKFTGQFHFLFHIFFDKMHSNVKIFVHGNTCKHILHVNINRLLYHKTILKCKHIFFLYKLVKIHLILSSI
jgi:hypothetical protein